MLIKTLLNKVERFKSFVYTTTQIMLIGGVEALVIDIVRAVQTILLSAFLLYLTEGDNIYP